MPLPNSVLIKSQTHSDLDAGYNRVAMLERTPNTSSGPFMDRFDPLATMDINRIVRSMNSTTSTLESCHFLKASVTHCTFPQDGRVNASLECRA